MARTTGPLLLVLATHNRLRSSADTSPSLRGVQTGLDSRRWKRPLFRKKPWLRAPETDAHHEELPWLARIPGVLLGFAHRGSPPAFRKWSLEFSCGEGRGF